MPVIEDANVFLSHNHRDKPMARALAPRLRLVGAAEVWFDEWKIRPGDSIVGRVNEALDASDLAVVLWSSNASASRWVGAELDVALSRALEDGSVRVVPVRLDDSKLPPLLRRLKWVEMPTEDNALDVAREIAGLTSDDEFRKAVQAVLDSRELELETFPGYGVMAGCPRCGAPLSELRGWSEIDERRDDVYAGAACNRCTWNDGSEI